MNDQAFVWASVGMTLAGTATLVLASWRAMRRAESANERGIGR